MKTDVERAIALVDTRDSFRANIARGKNMWREHLPLAAGGMMLKGAIEGVAYAVRRVDSPSWYVGRPLQTQYPLSAFGSIMAAAEAVRLQSYQQQSIDTGPDSLQTS